MPQHTRDWVDFLEALGPLTAALVAICIGITQWQLQRQQLKQDMFQKRLSVYRAVVDFVGGLLTVGSVDLTVYSRFRSETNAAQFLFERNVDVFVTGLYTLLIGSRWTPLSDGRLRIEDAAIEMKIREMFNRVFGAGPTDIPSVFRPYLQLYQEQSWLCRLAARANRWVNEAPDRMVSRYES